MLRQHNWKTHLKDSQMFGIPTLQTGVFGGIIIGALALGVITSFIIFPYHRI